MAVHSWQLTSTIVMADKPLSLTVNYKLQATKFKYKETYVDEEITICVDFQHPYLDLSEGKYCNYYCRFENSYSYLEDKY